MNVNSSSLFETIFSLSLVEIIYVHFIFKYDTHMQMFLEETVLLCHHWIHPLHVNNCLVQLSYQIWPQKTTEGSPDCWANHWWESRVSKRAGKIPLDPHIQHTPSLNCYRLVNATELWAPERPDTETVSFPKQSWTLDIKRGTYNTIIQWFIHHTYLFFISNLHIADLYTHNCL